ncbi:MAG: hypothetical protein K8R40_08645 [Anaerolineaceae bacterium]|nr:hypothetical protein [Anaerolineaceae bacterium]
MIELSIQTVIIFIGLMILLGLGFLGIIVFIVVRQLQNPEKANQEFAMSGSAISKLIQKAGGPIQSALKRGLNTGRWKDDQVRVEKNEVEGLLPIVHGHVPLVTLYRRIEDEKLAVLLPGKTSPAKQGELSETENSRLIRTRKELEEWLKLEGRVTENQPSVSSPVSTPSFAEVKRNHSSEKVKNNKEGNTMSMASQVNEILQSMLVSEHYQGPEIRMMDGLHGDLLIYVGSQKYTAIDDIPDKTIGDFIRKAADYWTNVNYHQ